MSVFNTIFSVTWLLSSLLLLFLIWRSSENRTQRMEVTLFDVVRKNSNTAEKAAEIAREAVETTKITMALLQEERKLKNGNGHN